MSVRFMLDEQSTMSREQECSAVQGSGSLTRCVVQKLLPSAARPALLRHIGPRASSAELPGLPRPLPLGEVARRRRDGEGKPVTAKPPHSDAQTLLPERYYRCAFASPSASLPSQALRASSPKGRAFGISAKFPLNEQSLFVSWAVVLRCPGQRQLDKVRCPEAAALCSEARPFAPYRTSGVQRRAARPAKASPFGRGGTPQA